ncbi:MAG: invasion associated locus B family protein [Rhizobiaceae bacterium]
MINLLGVVSASASSAQTNAAPTQSNPTSLSEVYADWTVSCRKAQTSTDDELTNCQMSQELRDKKSGQLILAFVLPAKPVNDGFNAVIVAPFGLNLEKGINLGVADSVDDNDKPLVGTGSPNSQAPFHTCLPAGCVARFKFDDVMFNALRKGMQAQLRMLSAESEKPIRMNVSLKGFTAAERRLRSLAKQFD